MNKTITSIIANTTRQTIREDARKLAQAEISRTNPGSASTALASVERTDLVAVLWAEMDKVVTSSTWVEESLLGC